MRKIAHWLECFSPSESIDILRDLALSHAVNGGKQGTEIARLLRRERYRELCEFDVDYEDGESNPRTLAHCRQAVAFFSKLEHLDIGVDKEKAAFEKFAEAESTCKETNEILRSWSRGGFQFPPRVESWLFKAQRQIATVLGPFPSFDTLGYRFGKGATSLTKKRLASVREKFRAGVSSSEELFPAAHALLGELPILSEAWADSYSLSDEEWWASVPVVIHDGRLEFVPKSAKTYRSTVTEPVLNGLYQLALGDYMSGVLLRVGLDLRDQTRNQRLAREGSLTGALATLDLSSASDTISKELVYNLLPLDWAVGLARGRSGHIQYRDQRLTLEKFSSMGNGYTFPLESLIFWALARAVSGPDDVVSVYGDDIICASKHFEDLSTLLRACGFSVNEKKSFHKGPFRESCGCDYYRGIDIRPYYQKKWVSNRTLFTLHNFYVRTGQQERAQDVLRFIHPDLMLFGPDGYGDGHLLGDHPRKVKASHSRRGFAGYVFDTFSVKPRRDTRPALGSDFVFPSYSIYRRSGELLVDLSRISFPKGESAPELKETLSKERLAFSCRFAREGNTAGSMTEVLPTPLAEQEDGSFSIAASFPLGEEDAYKRISIYTFGG